MKAVCQNDSLWNVQLYDVIVWISTASAEEDQHLLPHRCLFSPTHKFAHVVFTRGERAGLLRNQTIKMALNTTRGCAVQSCGKKTVFVLPSF